MTKWYSKKLIYCHCFSFWRHTSLDKYNFCPCRTITGLFSTLKIARACFCCVCLISLTAMSKHRSWGGGEHIYIYISHTWTFKLRTPFTNGPNHGHVLKARDGSFVLRLAWTCNGSMGGHLWYSYENSNLLCVVRINLTPPKFNIAPENDGWKMNFLLGPGLFSGVMLVSGRVKLQTKWRAFCATSCLPLVQTSC